MLVYRQLSNIDEYVSHLEFQKLMSRQSEFNSKNKTYGVFSKFQVFYDNRLRNAHNRAFVKKQCYRQAEFFRTVEPYALDKQQIKAVIADEDNCLVIAGAGSGKTSTIVAKVRYLVDVLNVPVNEILTISFTNKSAADMKKRINVLGLTPQTFHGFGLSVHMSVNGSKSIINDGSQNSRELDRYLINLIKKPEYFAQLNSFLRNFSKVPKSQVDFASKRQYERYVKEFKAEINEGAKATSPELIELAKYQVEDFLELCHRFLSLVKSNGYEISKVKTLLIESNLDELQSTRIKLFLELFEPIFNNYQHDLRDNNTIDFNDMIAQAISYLDEGLYAKKFSYVIIDEFQDLSFGRFRLLEAIRRQNPAVKFFCVGDDWQSIFRFAGSDIDLFKSFAKFFGHTYEARIETTYRFSQPLIKMSSDFVLKNPKQTYKALKTFNKSSLTSYSILESKLTPGDDTAAVVKALKVLEQLGLSSDSKVYIIGRYNFDFQRIKPRSGVIEPDPLNLTFRYTSKPDNVVRLNIIIEFVTAHKSKGLEADFVLIINCNSGKYGFPSNRADDPIINLLLSSADNFEDGEERRLFYVAMTRAKRHVVLIAEASRKSKFIKELQKDHIGKKTICPKCGRDKILKRPGKHGDFWKCTNYARGCTYATS